MTITERILSSFNEITDRDAPDFFETTGNFCLHPLRILCGYTYTYESGLYSLKVISTTESCYAAALLVFGYVITIPMTIIGFAATWFSDSHTACFDQFKRTMAELDNTTVIAESPTSSDSPATLPQGLQDFRDKTRQEAVETTNRYYNELKDKTPTVQRDIINNKHELILINIFRDYALSTDENEPSRDKLKYISECYFEHFPKITFDNHGYINLEIKIIINEFGHCKSVKEAMEDQMLVVY
ncbi:MAG: hypothetical protein WC222_08875 [Parachlamydiales bacterium]|jgi:hypothetical protein